MSKPSEQADAIVEAALDLPLAEQAVYLDKVCGGNAELRQLVDALLQAHRQAPDTRKDASDLPQGTIAFTLPPVEEMPQRIGRYKILQSIGEGGCGVVYMAEQEEPVRRRVALKVIKLGMDTKQVVARFEAERQALALMDHPNIAKVLDGGATETGRPYFVMELVRGIKLTDYCDQHNLPTMQRLELFVQICKAIQHAHQKGIIHRDIKPSNILVTLHDGVPVPKVIDFGIAKATDQRLTDKTLFTALEQFIGTPAYMSPEQAEMSGLDIDTRSDIYSLGVLLYELLTGKLPFEQKELLEAGLDGMRRMIREKDPVRPSTRLSSLAAEEQTTVAKRRQVAPPKLIHLVRGDLDWIVMRCLEKDRTRRYETANGLAREVERYLNAEPIVARPPSQFYKFQKLVRRNKLACAAAGGIAAALLFGLGLSTWLFFRERQAHRLTLEARKAARTEAAKSRQVASFLQEMLRGVDPSVAEGFDTKLLRRILDRTATRLDKELADQPAVGAELRVTIGEVYKALGQAAEAEAMFRQALATQYRALGSNNLDVAISLQDLGTALMDQDKLAEAEALEQQALALRRSLLGETNNEVAISLNELGLVLWHEGKLVEAENTNRACLEMRRKLFGNEHRDVAQSLNNLGIVLVSEGKFSDAETTHRAALAMRQQILSADDMDITFSQMNLSSALWNQGKLAEAETLQRVVITNELRILGPEHPLLANGLNNLATILWGQGKKAEAEKNARISLDMNRKLLGPDHVQIALALNNIGFMAWVQGNLPDAETLHREALAMRIKLLGKDHQDVAQSDNNLGSVLRDESKLSEAADLEKDALRIQRKISVTPDLPLARALDLVGLVLRDEQKFSEAEPYTRECLEIRTRLAPDAWLTFNTRSRLGTDLLGQKKYVEAESELVAGYEGMKRLQAKIPAEARPRFREAIERLATLYAATGRGRQAEDLRKEIVELNLN